MNAYWDRVKETLFRNSVEPENLEKARKEWRYFSGNVQDHREDATFEDYPACELCEHPNIRFSFIIKNIENGNELKVGSECIQKFIEVTDGGAIVHDSLAKKAILASDIKKIIKDARTKKVIENIVALAYKDDTFKPNCEGFLKRLDRKNGFSINQLKWLFALFNKNKIAYDINNYKINLKKKKEQAQIQMLEEWQFKAMKPIIPKKFQERYQNLRKPVRTV